METIKLTVGDVYSFAYKPEFRKSLFDPYHCFDGQLVVKQSEHRGLYLEDTYWGYGDSRTFTPSEAQEKGELTFKCNLDDVEVIGAHDLAYYADEDIFNISHQHNCYQKYAKKKTAVRNLEKMKSVVSLRIDDEKSKIRSAENNLKHLNETLESLGKGITDGIYL